MNPTLTKAGKAQYANVNHMDAHIILWKPNTDYGIYISMNYEEAVKNGAEHNYNSSLRMEPLSCIGLLLSKISTLAFATIT